MSRTFTGPMLALVCVSFAGCGGGSTALQAPKFDPSEAGAAAITEYDKDGDGQLSQAELKACPAITLQMYDQNGDKKVSADEIQARMQSFFDQNTKRLMQSCVVNVRGRGLEGATVRLEPEAFLGDSIAPADGVSDRRGGVNLAAEYGGPGVQFGLYKVRITHPDRQIPAKYNTDTILGLEVDPLSAHTPIPVYDVGR